MTPASASERGGTERPAHPMRASILLVVGVVLLIVVLSVASTLS